MEDADGNITYRCYGVAPVCDVLLTRTEKISYWQYHQGDRHYLVLKEPVGEQAVCLVVDSEALYEQLVSDIHVGTNGYIIVKSAENRVVMHPERKQWGLDILEGRQELYYNKELEMDSLSGLLKTQQEELSGIMDYYSYWWMDPSLPRVHKISAYRQLSLGDSFWIVSAVVDYDDLYQLVADSFRKMTVMFGSIALVLVLLTVFIFRLQQKNTRSAARITSLQEVNDALEISEAAEKARDVVKQISAMSRKNVETIYDAIPVERLLTQTRKLVETNCPRQVQLVEKMELKGEEVLGNSTQLRQVLLNICVNAIHAIGPAEGTLTLEADVVPRSELLRRFPDERIPEVWPSYVRIRITDTGSGMDKETLQRIFEPFFTTKKTGEGTGLGLALAEQIIHTHRGQICAESTLGKGSTFFIYLPVLEQEREREQLQWGQNSNLRILAVDGNQKVLSMLEKELSRLGLDVSTCARRGDVRTLLDSQPFDVLAIDESVTKGSGVDFCISIQGRFPGMTRIVMASALTRELIDAKSHGVMDGYILKPVAASTLLEEIRACRKK